MSETQAKQDARTAPVLVWDQLKDLSKDELASWRIDPVKNNRTPEERGINLPMPFGWFVVCYSDELAKGEVKPVSYFERELVVWRGEDGAPRVLDAYCPHLGAHLGYGGKVNGNDIQCPFHSWSWNGEGAATDIPYSKSIPPKMKKPACERAYPTRELSGFVWMWYHPENIEPIYEPRNFDEIGDPNWTGFEKHEWIVYGPMQTIAENGADAAHFQFIHGVADSPNYDIAFDGHRRTAAVRAKMGTPRGIVDGTIDYGVDGAGQPWTRFGGICETLMLAGVTPISANKTHLRFAFTQLKSDRDGDNGGVAKAIIKDICKQLDQDKVVWDRQMYIANPPLCAGDGPINDFRDFFRQFYAGEQYQSYRDKAVQRKISR